MVTGNVDPAHGQVWEYDPVANTWDTSRLALPHPIGGAGFGIINGHFYVAGGRDIVDVAYNGLWDYDIAANTWTQRTNLLAGDNVPGSAVINGQLWIFGGGNPFLEVPTTTNATQIYDPVSNSWANGPSLTAARSFVVGTAVGNTVFAAGGYNGSTTVATAETAGGPCPPGGTPTPSPSATCVPGGGTTVSYTGAPVAIPDNNTTGVNLRSWQSAGLERFRDLDFRFDGTVSSPDPLSTTVGVNHSWVGDMIFRLTSPGGTTVTFYDRPGVPASTFGCSSNNLFALTMDDEAGSALEGQCPGDTDAGPLTGSFTPNNPLSAFDGQNADGNWTLTAIDAAGGDVGTVRAFSLIFGGGGCASPTTIGHSRNPDAVAVSVVSAGDHAFVEPGDHAAELSLVQQRAGPYGQQLLESVQHGNLCRRSAVQRDLGLLRSGRSDRSRRNAAGDGASLYDDELPGRSVPWRYADPDRDDHDPGAGCASGTVLSVPLVATVPAGTSELVMEVFTPERPSHGELVLHRIECGGGDRTELSERGRLRDNDTDGHGDDRVPGHEHCVQRPGELRDSDTDPVADGIADGIAECRQPHQGHRHRHQRSTPVSPTPIADA